MGSIHPSFEISRGKTAFPVRPIEKDRFLIGSGEWCDLRLGGGTPRLHSVVVIKNGRIQIECVGPHCQLSVNGKRCSCAELNSQDIVQVGQIELIFHSGEPASKNPLMQPVDIDAMLALDQPANSLAEMSAEELADQLDADMRLVEEFEQGRELAVESVIEAASTASLNPSTRILHELETAVQTLNNLAIDLKSAPQNRKTAEAGATLLQYQTELASRLDEVLERIAAFNHGKEQKVA